MFHLDFYFIGHKRNDFFVVKTFAMESLGGFGESCGPILAKIGCQLSGVDKIMESQAIRRLKQRLQCCWMKILGASLMNKRQKCN